MAVARMVCGNCGGVLGTDEQVCSRCGERVEREVPRSGAGTEQHVHPSCPVCGHANTQQGVFCESCGSRLVVPMPDPVAAKPATASDKKVRAGFRFEAWQIAVAGVLVVLLGFFIYQEVNRDHGVAHDHANDHERQQAAPRMRAALAGDIARLEEQVSKNPGDAGAVLQLANVFHDASQAEPRYLMRAIDTYKKYLEMQPSDPNARVDLGICYFEVGRIDSSHAGQFFSMAIREMKGAIQEHPSHQSAAFNLGIVTLYAGDAGESTRWFTKAVEINPESDLGRRAKNLLDQHSFTTQ